MVYRVYTKDSRNPAQNRRKPKKNLINILKKSINVNTNTHPKTTLSFIEMSKNLHTHRKL